MKKVLVILVTMVTATILHADLLATWDVNGIDVADGTGIDEGVSPYRFTASLGSNIGDAKLSLGTGANPSTSSSQYGFKLSTQRATLADAIANNDYLQFTISAAGGYQLNLTSIEMNGQSSATGFDDAAIMSDIAGFTAGNELAQVNGITNVTGGLDTDASGWGGPIDLSGASYQGVASATFRIYGWNASSGAGVGYIRNLTGDDLIINGTVAAIPEPATFGFMAIGLVGIFLSRRKIRG